MTLSRRGFLTGTGALCLGVSFGLPGCGSGVRGARIRKADSTGDFDANMFITVLASGRVVLSVAKAEIGQGVNTGYATLVAEELSVELETVDCVTADSLPEFRLPTGIPMVNLHYTGGSTSIFEAWKPLRKAAAAAREMLIGAAATQWGVGAPSCTTKSGRVHHQSSGRSLGYGELTRNAARQSVPSSPQLKSASEFRVIGKRQTRNDAIAKVTGTATYGIDVKVDGMVNAAVIHPPVYGAKAKSFDAAAAKSMTGVIDVFAFFAGVAVVADKYWQAAAAAREVKVIWGEGQVEGLNTAKMSAAMRDYKKAGAVVREIGSGSRGEKSLKAIYEAPYLAHAPLEPMNCTAVVKNGKAELWAPCQIPTVVQETVSDATGIDRDDVLVHTTFSGGGFGRRGLGDFAAQAASIAQKVGRPVKMLWTRESEMKAGFYRPMATGHFEGSVKDGRAHSVRIHILSQAITADQVESARGGMASFMPKALRHLMATSVTGLVSANTSIDLFSHEGASHSPYQIPNFRVEFTPVHSKLPVAFWRSVGHSYNAFYLESFVDELAALAGADPYEFRRDMLKPESRERRVLDEVAKLSGWSQAKPKSGHALGIARHSSFRSEVAEVAEVAVEGGRIRVKRVFCVVDCGIAINPDVVKAQIEGAVIFGLSAALDQKITIRDGVVQQGNFDDFPALRMHEAPEIIVKIMPSEASPTGVGEPGLPPIAAAVANAVFRSTNVRLRRMPLQEAWNEQKGNQR